MEIKESSFVKSSAVVDQCPPGHLPEYAFIGRSNVGKSSLINMLTKRKKLAMTSAKPGKTLLINHFLIDNNWHLVDLPGYGFASVPKPVRDKLEPMITGYILRREQLTCLFVLVDCRHEPQKVDLDFIEFLGEHEVPFSIVFTKSDKISHARLQSNVEAYKSKLLEKWEELPRIFCTSAEHNDGREELLSYIDDINKTLQSNG
jgi:GTP-binding protein